MVEDVLKDWTSKGIDVVLAPGLGMPAQPLGYPAWELGAISYTCVYNMLNFPSGSVPVSMLPTIFKIHDNDNTGLVYIKLGFC